jgi:peptidoglycan/LPS O-acetylase OafA/YrhL
MAVTATRRGPGEALVRTDIQGLRAVAVSLVLLYHLWPNRLSGGFTGVDVFFVISGFLITAHLLAHPPRRARNLFEFWSRRVRRLLPASLLVLIVTLAVSRLVAPDTQWENTARDVRAAALYVVNWRLANNAVDYLAAENAASPVQHFWSLSVEEQFYFVWPILILLLVGVAVTLRWRLVPTVIAGLGAGVAASLWFSVHETALNPAAAYFVTPTRMWELGIGGLLAALLSGRALGRRRSSEAVPLPAAVRAGLAWAGLAAMVCTAFVYTGRTPFPGYQALLPVLGTAAVIAAASPITWWSPGPLLAVRPMQWLGDISYSVYLWHWPMIVLVPSMTGRPLADTDKIAIIAASLVLATLTKRYVEDRFRTGNWGRPLFKPFALGALAMAVVVAGTAAQVTEAHHRATLAQHRLQRAIQNPQPCFGAAALAAPDRCRAAKSAAKDAPLTPAPLQAAKDKSDAYPDVSGGPDCFAYLPSVPIRECERGDLHSDVDVVLVGNSHAGEWVPTLESIAATEHWKLTLLLASECAYADVLEHFSTTRQSQACRDWTHGVTQRITELHPDLVVMTNRISLGVLGSTWEESLAKYSDGYRAVIAKLRAAQLNVVGIRDTPAPGKSLPDCLASHPDDHSACDGTRAKWLPVEPLTKAVAALADPGATEVDLTDHICEPVTCPAVVGGVPVYFDGSHLSATYARTLAPYLRPYLVKALTA